MQKLTSPSVRFFQNNKYILLTKWRGQDAWILAKFSIFVFMDPGEVEVHNAKRERGQYPAILTELAWSIRDLL